MNIIFHRLILTSRVCLRRKIFLRYFALVFWKSSRHLAKAVECSQYSWQSTFASIYIRSTAMTIIEGIRFEANSSPPKSYPVAISRLNQLKHSHQIYKIPRPVVRTIYQLVNSSNWLFPHSRNLQTIKYLINTLMIFHVANYYFRDQH